MSEECNHNCESCSSDCKERKIQKEECNSESKIKKVIAVMSGKGGVGKTLITTMMSVLSQRKGYHTAIMDADITGPSVPASFGIKERAMSEGEVIIPVSTQTGIKVMSMNLLLDHDTDPVIWRGPIIAGVVKQFWSQVKWGETDYMFVDMPPGTGDVPLTVFQSIPVDGIILVTSPQEMVSMIVEKAVNMAEAMKIPMLGIIENMSYYVCPDCHSKHALFGESHIDQIAQHHHIPVLARIPMEESIVSAVDTGHIEDLNSEWVKDLEKFL